MNTLTVDEVPVRSQRDHQQSCLPGRFVPTDAERHLHLSTRTLRPQTVMDYGIEMPQNSIRSAGGRGRRST
ncbi:hypothetical protein [Micromonospora sp. NPDC005220]|uniref:hypothetical protein n=1 Tax=Micromonospora sp. NPDC005220 TaxID=3155589 RepID=UPI0033A5E0A9